MKNRSYRLTESQLHRVVVEGVKKALRESGDFIDRGEYFPNDVCPYCGCGLVTTYKDGKFSGYEVCPECFELFSKDELD